MPTAGTVYILIFTFFNIYITMYLQSSVNSYKSNGKLPRWAIKSRAFLDNLDDTIKSEEIEKINASIFESVSAIGWMDLFKNGQYSNMAFLQIKADADNTYEVRDDYELKKSKANEKPVQEEADLDGEEKNETTSINDPTTIVDALFKASLDVKEIDEEEAKADSTGYDNEPKKLKKLDETMNEFESVAQSNVQRDQIE
jgi:hypothetical protein